MGKASGPNETGLKRKKNIIAELTKLGICPKRPHEQKISYLERILKDAKLP